MITKDNNYKVMKLFFNYPERKFHLRELERLTGLSLPGVRKIVLDLEKEGLLMSKKEKMVKNFYASRNEKFVHLKRSYNLYEIFSSGLLSFLKSKYHEPEAIVLFGSYSKGEDTSQSDIDIAVITQQHQNLQLDTFEKELARKIMIYETTIGKAEKEFLKTLINGILLSGYLGVKL